MRGDYAARGSGTVREWLRTERREVGAAHRRRRCGGGGGGGGGEEQPDAVRVHTEDVTALLDLGRRRGSLTCIAG